MIKNYYEFIIESNKYFSIYDFLEWLNKNCWSKSIDKSELIKHTEHFIGKGQWNIIEKHFDKIFNSLENIDIDYINDRLLDIFDEYPLHDSKYAVCAVCYSNDYTGNITGTITVSEVNENKKLNIIMNFLMFILNKSLFIHYFKNTIQIRTTNDELYVTSDEWSLKNLKYQDIDILKDDKTDINFRNFLKFKNEFSIDKYLNLYLPAIFIYISGGGFGEMSKISLNKITKQFEDILPSILHDIDYSDILYSWKLPKYSDDAPFPLPLPDIEIYDFDLKIILNI